MIHQQHDAHIGLFVARFQCLRISYGRVLCYDCEIAPDELPQRERAYGFRTIFNYETGLPRRICRDCWKEENTRRSQL